MGIKIGIVGQPNVGKSTLFNAITNSTVEAANYPFATIEPNIGVVKIPDKRLSAISKIVHPKKIIHSTIEFFDIAGLIEGASKGEGLGNKFLSHIRSTDAIVHVVRCFDDPNITHVNGRIDPIHDVEIINLELLYSDIETINKIISRTNKKSFNEPRSFAAEEYKLAKRIRDNFLNEIPVRDVQFEPHEEAIVKQWNLLTHKPVLFIANIEENLIKDPSKSDYYKQLFAYAQANNKNIVPISAKIENEIAKLESLEDKKDFIEDIGLEQSGLDVVIKESFKLLSLETFFTAGKIEVKSWTFKKNTKAPQCAGIIHSDFEKGFIKAEVIHYDDYINFKGEQNCRDNGKFHIEGKQYIIKDGDVVHFRFNVSKPQKGKK